MPKEETLEINFFEPALGLIITNLEFLEEELEQEKINVEALTKFIDKLSEMDSYEQYADYVQELSILSNALLKEIAKVVDADRYQLLSYLYTATTLAFDVTEQGLFMKHALTFEGREGMDDEALIEEMKKYIISVAVNKYTEMKTSTEFKRSEEFNKVVDVLLKEEDFRDLKEGNDVLIELFATDNKLVDNFDKLSNSFKALIEIDGLITLVTFWEQGDIDEDEE